MELLDSSYVVYASTHAIIFATQAEFVTISSIPNIPWHSDLYLYLIGSIHMRNGVKPFLDLHYFIIHEPYSCNKITKTKIQISRQK